MCFGTCPAYRVVLQPNGKLSYEGIAYVKRKGKFTASFHPDEFRKLVAIAKRVGFDSLAPSYSAPVTDMPTAIVTVKRGTAVKRVSDYGSSAPAEAWAMQELIDVVVNGADDWKPVKKAG
jgi:hypothetical protein